MVCIGMMMVCQYEEIWWLYFVIVLLWLFVDYVIEDDFEFGILVVGFIGFCVFCDLQCVDVWVQGCELFVGMGKQLFDFFVVVENSKVREGGIVDLVGIVFVIMLFVSVVVLVCGLCVCLDDLWLVCLCLLFGVKVFVVVIDMIVVVFVL